MVKNQHLQRPALRMWHLLITVFVIFNYRVETKEEKKDSKTEEKAIVETEKKNKVPKECTYILEGEVYVIGDHNSTKTTCKALVLSPSSQPKSNISSRVPADILVHLYISYANTTVRSIGKIFDVIKINHIKQGSIKTLILHNASIIIDNSTQQTFMNFSELERLYLGHNHLTKISNKMLSKLRKLVDLGLTHNKLEVIENGAFDDLKHLRSCDISHNRVLVLETGHFRHLQNLEFLNVSSNFIKTIQDNVFKNCSKLLTLDISQNHLQHLNPDVFTGLTKVECLDLSGNRLKELWTGVLNGLAALQYLHLTSNQIHSISPSVFEPTLELKTLYLTNNTLAWVTLSSFTGLDNSTSVYVERRSTCCFIDSANCCVNNSCSSGDPEDTICHRLLLNQGLVVTVWILAACGIAGNVGVIGYQGKQMFRKKKPVHLLLVTNLSTSDLIMGVYMLILASADMYFAVCFPNHSDIWRLSPLCHFAGVVCMVSSEASVCFATLISIERFLCVKFPTNRHRIGKLSAIITIVLIWLLSITIALVPIIPKMGDDELQVLDICIGLPLSWDLSADHNGEMLGMVIFVFTFLCFNSLCFLIVAVCCTVIIFSLKRSSHKLGRDKLSKRDIRITKQVAAVVMTDFFTWLPIIFVFILNHGGLVQIHEWGVTMMVALAFTINSCINPFLYTFSALISEWMQMKKNKTS